jgi:hypothetical protein
MRLDGRHDSAPGLYGAFMFASALSYRILMCGDRTLARCRPGISMLDMIALACGTGGILLMGAYAALCERV